MRIAAALIGVIVLAIGALYVYAEMIPQPKRQIEHVLEVDD